MKAKIQQDRLEYAEMRILELGYDIFFKNDSQFHFEYMGNTIRVFPYTGWFTGVGVTDGRGLENLLKQIGLIGIV